MSPILFTKFWHVIGEATVAAFQSFFHSSFLLKSINETLMSIIPRTEIPLSLAQFRPMNLCNVLYKAIFKLRVERLELILGSCISDKQATFVLSWQILSNVILTHEFLHFFKNKRNGLKSYMTLKLDMSKAYDRVKWLIRAWQPLHPSIKLHQRYSSIYALQRILR